MIDQETLGAAIGYVNQHGGGGGGTSNYNDLSNKPSINGVELKGNKTAANLSLLSRDEVSANPTGTSSGILSSIGIKGTKYDISSSSEEIKNLDNKMLSHSTDSGYIIVDLDVNLTAGKVYKVTIRDAVYDYVDTKEIIWNTTTDVIFSGKSGSGEYKIQLTQTTVSLYNYGGSGWRDIYCDIVSNYVQAVQSDWNESDSTKEDYIKNKPTLGTASAKNVPASGDASSSQVVMGNDSRLTDSRPASDVPSWAKQPTKPSYSASEVGLGNVPNVATNDQTPTFTEASERANIASGEKLSVIMGKIKKFFADLKTVAFSGSYNDLTDKPSLATVATSGSYADLSNKPTIPTSAGGITYDNTDSGLSATDVQGAVDELTEEKTDKSNIAPDFSSSLDFQKKSLCWYEGKLYEFQEYHAAGAWIGTDVTEKNLSEVLSAYPWSLGDKLITVTADGVKTYSQLLNQLYPYRNRLYRLEIDSTQYYPTSAIRYGHVGGTSGDDINFRLIVLKETGSIFKSATINSSTGAISVSDQGSGVPAEGVKIRLVKSFMS